MRRIFAALRRHFRQRRYLRLRDLMVIESQTGLILDLGGGPASFFAAMFSRQKQVILLDIDYDRAYQAKCKYPLLRVIVADGERLPLADRSVDMTICNSVIEHVDSPEELAREIRRVGWGYFLQTPNGDFPLETHSFIAIPLYSFIPWVWSQRLMCRVFGGNFEYLRGVRYLSEQRLRAAFPDATIGYEKVFGLIKSFYVYRLNERME